MTTKRILQCLVVVVFLVASFVSTGGVLAWSSCTSFITVQPGDTWSSIATTCGTTVDALQAANPSVGWFLFPGQVLYIPLVTGTPAPAYYPPQSVGSTYVIQWGDTLGDIALRYGISLSDILSVNPQIWNADLIFPGQTINLPVFASYPTPTNIPYNCYPSTCATATPFPPYCDPSVYNPYFCNPSSYYPTTTPSPQYLDIKIISVPGLIVRSGPGQNYSEILSPFVSAVNKTWWKYRIDSVTVDSTGLVWVEVTLSPMVNGYATGWIMVRDQLGSHFTEPKIDP
jgi:LysM repeat protein